MGDCMGLFLSFLLYPTPLRVSYVANDSLAAVFDIYMLDDDSLLPLATVAIEGFHLCREGTH